MKCEEVSQLLDSYVDGEFIDAVRIRQIESHLDSCPGCRHQLEALRKVRQIVREEATYFKAPDRLFLKLEGIGQEEPAMRVPKRQSWLRPAFGFSSLAIACLMLLVFVRLQPQTHNIEAELVASHVRSLQATHLYDVVSTDKHTVKPWFQGKLDFAPDVPNMASEGFPLLGGRLDYLDRHAAAAIVYRHAKHIINVFVLPGSVNNDRPSAADLDGYHLVKWNEHSLRYWAVSDMDISTLTTFSQKFKAATSP